MRKIGLFKEYVARLTYRVIVLLTILYGYIFKPKYFDLILTKRVALKWDNLPFGDYTRDILEQYNNIWIWIIWIIFMISMIQAMFPTNKHMTIGSLKRYREHYHEVEGYDKLEMYKYIQRANYGALWVLIVWLLFNSVFGLLYVMEIIDTKELILVSAFYFVSDLICVVIWCPFQQFFIKNKCCVNCRIFNWGHFMMFTPMIFIRNFWTWSLFFTSVIVLLRWELTLILYPERFWEGSNAVLSCANCRDKMCIIKKPRFLNEIGEIKVVKKMSEEDFQKPLLERLERDLEEDRKFVEKYKNRRFR